MDAGDSQHGALVGAGARGKQKYTWRVADAACTVVVPMMAGGFRTRADSRVPAAGGTANVQVGKRGPGGARFSSAEVVGGPR